MSDDLFRTGDAGESLTRKGGGKLNRSETVTVRLDPKLNYLCELAARAHRRTKSSFIEWSVAESLGAVILPEVVERSGWDVVQSVTLKDRASALWHVDEADRLVALAFIAPALLTHEEQIIWKYVRENGFLWRGSFWNREWTWTVSEENLIRGRLRDHWEIFRAVALGERQINELPSWIRTEPINNLNDEIPF